MLRPVCSETDFTADIIGAARCSLSGKKAFTPSLVIRPPSGLPSPWYFPVRNPPARGEKARTPKFKALAMGISSRSTVRSIRLYSSCSPINRVQPRSSARGLGDPPGGSVRDADVKSLALANQIVQTAHDFFHRRDPVPDVHPVQVDVVGLQSFQTGFHRLHHVLAMIARRIRIIAWRGVGVLRG